MGLVHFLHPHQIILGFSKESMKLWTTFRIFRKAEGIV